MITKTYFGTDGIRGRVGRSPITADFMLKLGWAAGRVFSRHGKSKILIGKDTRISGYMFESALEAGLSAAGVDILLLGPMPTPAIAYLTKTFRADAGIVISASHNPFFDNGIKFFSGEGTKLSDEMELAIEAELQQAMVTVESDHLGKARRVDDAGGRYVEYCKSTAPGLSLKGKKIVIDCAHGATYDVAPKVFSELGADITVIGNKPNGLNINEGVGSTSPKQLKQVVLESNADLGIAFDGDGDRVLMVDDQGELVDGDELLYIIARNRKENGGLNGGVVGTLMTNLGLERALEKLDIPLVRAKVGDRYVLELLSSHNWILGGENSGHLVCKDVSTTGDGIVSALQVLKALVAYDQSLYQAKSGMRKFPQEMINVQLPRKMDILAQPEVVSGVQAAEKELGSSGRVLLRPSGTEPVVRVMVEGEDPALVRKVCRHLAAQVENAIN
ncbi:phosphomannomutase [Gynuella sunshinyii YC6258]|uniref:Phosphoglucosamine mutase n=1 Tax=Gynuella sunshinyii YC6258 TaxID=1445510 RepID=A0A0C5VSX0_9GAMM|nr:phosphomannomutase [Gynuella sunshinyii YC6258]